MSQFSTERFLLPVTSSLGDWIAALDEDGAEKALLEKVLKFFDRHNITVIPAVASLSQTDLASPEGWPTDLEAKSFLRRCHQMTARTSAVKAPSPAMASSTGQWWLKLASDAGDGDAGIER